MRASSLSALPSGTRSAVRSASTWGPSSVHRSRTPPLPSARASGTPSAHRWARGSARPVFFKKGTAYLPFPRVFLPLPLLPFFCRCLCCSFFAGLAAAAAAAAAAADRSIESIRLYRGVLCCVMALLCCTVLRCVALCCVVLHCAVLRCAVLRCIIEVLALNDQRPSRTEPALRSD